MENKTLSPQQKQEIIKTLKDRFVKNMNRHTGVDFEKLESELIKNDKKLWSLYQMEQTGGEPDVIGFDKKTKEYIFCDCSPDSPKGRRSLCYDQESLDSRKEYKPKDSAIGLAEKMGTEVLSEEEYLNLQTLGGFDTKTSSWVKTPLNVRKLGGAIFADFRFGRTFFYHNGAESYYAVRGFRTSLRV